MGTWSKPITWQNILQLKLGDIQGYTSRSTKIKHHFWTDWEGNILWSVHIKKRVCRWRGKLERGTVRCQRLAQQMLISWRKQQHHWFKKINKREKKMQILWLVGITVSEVLVMAKMTCNGTKKNMLFNLLSLMSD